MSVLGIRVSSGSDEMSTQDLEVSAPDPRSRERIARLAGEVMRARGVSGPIRIRVPDAPLPRAWADAHSHKREIRVSPRALIFSDGAVKALLAHEIAHLHHRHGEAEMWTVLALYPVANVLALVCLGPLAAMAVSCVFMALFWAGVLPLRSRRRMAETEAEAFAEASVTPEEWRAYQECFGPAE